jgi:hypothetical protein
LLLSRLDTNFTWWIPSAMEERLIRLSFRTRDAVPVLVGSAPLERKVCHVQARFNDADDDPQQDKKQDDHDEP